MSISNLVAGSGRFTANGAAAVVVPCPNLTASSVVLISSSTSPVGANPPAVSVLTLGTSFSVVCGGANANVYNYIVLNA